MISKQKLVIILLAVGFFLFFNMQSASAAITGKISGKVIDAETKEPLPGANIIIEGTTLGAATNVNGEYYILNVPPGVYELSCRMIGYATVKLTNVRVKSDLTTEANFALKQVAVAGQEVTIVAERPIIQKDVAGTEMVMDREEMNAYSQNSFTDFLMSQVGVEYSDNSNERGVSIRGGDVDESDVLIDGVSMRSSFNKQAALSLAMSAIKEVSISPGGISAEYGDVRSGVIRVVTREGSRSNYSFAFDARIAPPQKKHFYANSWARDGWVWQLYAGPNAMRGEPDPEAFLDRYYMNNDVDWTRFEGGYYGYVRDKLTKNPDYKNTPQQELEYLKFVRNGDIRPYANRPDYILDASIGGPVSFLKNATFLIADHYENLQFVTPGVRPNSITNFAQANITFRLNPSMKLTWINMFTHEWGLVGGGRLVSLSGMVTAGWGSTRRTYSAIHGNEEPGQATPELKKATIRTGLRFSHTLSARTFYTLQLDATKYSSRGGTAWKDVWDNWSQDPRIPMWRVGNDWAIRPLSNPFVNFWHDDAMGESNLGSFHLYPMPHDDSQYREIHIKGTIESQINYRNQLKMGFEANYSELDIFGYSGRHLKGPFLPPFFQENNQPDVGSQVIRGKPFTFGAFIQDKLEYEGMIATIGVRYDLFNSGQNAWDVKSFEGGWTIDGYKEDPLFKTRRTKGWAYSHNISPRLGISFPATETSKFYFNYGHYYTLPNPIDVLKIDTRYVNRIPNLYADWPRTVSYEAGFEKALSDEFLFRISAYYKDDTNQLQWVTYKAPGGGTLFLTQENNVYRDIRGFEIRLQQRQGRFGYGYVDFEYRTTSNGITGFRERYESESDQKQASRFDPRQDRFWPRPRVNMVYSFRLPVGFGPTVYGIKPLSDWTLQLNGYWQAGGKVLFAEGTFAFERKYLERIDSHNLDIGLRKRFQWKYLSYTFYMNIRNVTNYKGLMGDLNTQDYKNSLKVPWGIEGVTKGNDKWGQGPMDDGREHIWSSHRPWRWFVNPRQVWFGLQLSWR